jgi:hypothetical protein
MRHQTGNWTTGMFAVLLVSTGLGSLPPAQAQKSPAPPQCRQAGPLARVPELPEASGIALSRRAPGRLWAHNDSGEPVLFALDTDGRVIGRVNVTGAKVEDWEAVAVGPCAAGSCLYAADIGDNDAERQRISIYRVPEPDRTEGSTPASDVIHATYPDGPHDAETLLIAPDGGLFVVTKGDTGPVALYKFPHDLRAGESVRLERVGRPRTPGKARRNDRITDGSVSPDGQWVVLRTPVALHFYPAVDFFAGNWREAPRMSLKALAEPQGEAVAFGDGILYLAGEGGGKSRPGTFGRMVCGSDRSESGSTFTAFLPNPGT